MSRELRRQVSVCDPLAGDVPDTPTRLVRLRHTTVVSTFVLLMMLLMSPRMLRLMVPLMLLLRLRLMLASLVLLMMTAMLHRFITSHTHGAAGSVSIALLTLDI